MLARTQRNWIIHTLLMKIKWYAHYGKKAGSFYELNMYLPHDYDKINFQVAFIQGGKKKNNVKQKLLMNVLTPLFLITKNWK